MSHNSFGRLYRFTTWGESHGPAIGCVIDGCPPGVFLDEERIQTCLDRRRPGQNKFVTQRDEADRMRILSGLFEGHTTGTPICIMIENTDQRSKDYGDIANQFRPGHADYTYWAKYGIRDYRGGGRASARETASRVAAGAVAQQLLEHVLGPVTARAAVVSVGDIKAEKRDFDAPYRNDFFFADQDMVPQLEEYLAAIRKSGSSIGAKLAMRISGVPAGLGDPVADRLDARLAGAMMSINAVKSVEIGAGVDAARLTGEQNADEMKRDGDGIVFLDNHAGGVLGGVSTGQDIILEVAIKPTSSILTPTKSINRFGEEIEVRTKGRHDPCVGLRAVPVLEAMAHAVMLDMALLQRGQVGQFARPFDRR
ncbi:MAG: chorismate synthase [Rhodobacteraceae bacterium]|nr:chorismate synthase [Paracoccaceae bacterium]